MEGAIIKKRFDALVQNRKTLEDTYQVLERFVVPYRGEFFKPMSEEQEVEWRRRDIFDSTAVEACQTLAASMQGSLTSPSVKWFSLSFRKDALNHDNASMRWLEECENRIYEALQDSNFNLEASEFYLDLSSFGTAVLVEEVDDEDDDWEAIDFSAAPIVDVYFEMNSKGGVEILYRRLKWLPLQIMEKFGEDNVPEWVREAHNNAGSTRIEMVFCVYPRKDKKDADTSKFLAKDQRPYGCKYIFHKDANQIGEEGGKYEMPAFVARFRKVAGSRWGHSPAFVCLSDILTLNQLTEETLEALGKVVDPSTVVTERGLLSDLDLGRGGLTVVRSKDDIWAYESKARFDVGELRIDRLVNSIRRAFFVDQLEMKESPAMTATEVQVRYELMQRLLGPTLGRLQSDFLDPCITRTFNILMRSGRLPEPPEIVVQEQSQYDVNYTGPLPRAQRMQLVESINQFVGNTAALAEVYPQVLDIPDMDEVAREVARLSGVPAKLIRDEKEVQKERTNKQARADRAMAAQQAQAEGDAAQSVAAGQVAIQEAAAING